ncbi:hypothetical protein [Mucilaginibacter sp.]|jgi:hypothetical protein|uniref:hypothetical protein n=1 Tax=Mucilaginibacter sp. TaxID=1882438 RepID=UPI003568C7C6
MKNQACLLIIFVLGLAACKKELVPIQATVKKEVSDLAPFPSTTNFNVTFPGYSYNRFTPFISTYANNGYILACNIGVDRPHIALIKINQQGQNVWVKKIAGSGMEEAESILAIADSAYLIGGVTSSRDGDFAALKDEGSASTSFIMKIDCKGKVIWVKSFGGITNLISSIISTCDNNYAAVGEATIIKINKDGKLLWNRKISSGIDLTRVVQDKKGNFVIGETTFNGPSPDFLLIKLTDRGIPLWQKFYGGSGVDLAHDMIIDKDNNYILVGSTLSKDGDVAGLHPPFEPGIQNQDGWVLKADQDGNKLWAKVFGGTLVDEIRSLTNLNNGQYLAAGFSSSYDFDLASFNFTEVFRGWALKINADGTLHSEQVFQPGATIGGELFYIQRGDSNNYLAAGLSLNTSPFAPWLISIPNP